MSRQFDLSKPLSDADVDYLNQRMPANQVAHMVATSRGSEFSDTVQAEDRKVVGPPPFEYGSTGHPLPLSNPSVAPGGVASDESTEAEAGPYDGMTVDELQTEIDKRNDASTDDAEKIARTGVKAELISRLEQSDATK